MSAKEPGLGELSEFVSDHFFGDKHLIEHFSVMDEERMPDKLRHDGAGASPSFDRLFFTDGFQFLDLSVQFWGNERTFLDRSTHNFRTILQRKTALGRGGCLQSLCKFPVFTRFRFSVVAFFCIFRSCLLHCRHFPDHSIAHYVQTPHFPFTSVRFPIRIAFCSPFQAESDRHRRRINTTTIMNLTQRLLLRSQQPRQRHCHTRQYRPNLSPLRTNRMLVLLKITILLQVQTVFDLPMSQDSILKLQRRNLIGIKTAYKIASFRRRRLSLSANLFIKTNPCPTIRHVQKLTNLFRRPLLYPQTTDFNSPLFLLTRRS